jgi:hypothetical protein
MIVRSLSFILYLLSLFTSCYSQQTGVTCSAVTPISVPRDPSLYWGTWYTIATCTACTNPSNVCSQVAFEPIDETNIATNLSYIGSYQRSSPDGIDNQAYGKMIPLNFETFDPLYKLELNVGVIVTSNYWIITTAGSDGEITAIVTMSCELSDTNQQLFFLSRKPYFVPPVTFDYLASQVQRAITNYDQFNISAVLQQQGWCDYQLVETETVGNDSNDDDDEDENWEPILVALIVISVVFSLSTLIFLLWSKFSNSSSDKKQLI